MENNQLERLLASLLGFVKSIFVLVLLLVFSTIYFAKFYDPADFESEDDLSEVIMEKEPEISDDGIHVATGLIADVNYELVVTNCTNCHSSKLITQNRATKEGWRSMIEWMQETQNLWELGENEDKIIDYLAKNYAPDKQSRRQNLKDVEWYELD